MQFSNSINGIQSAFRRQNESAQLLANLNNDNYTPPEGEEVDLAGEMVNQIINRHSVSLNTGVIRTRNSMLGELLDLQA